MIPEAISEPFLEKSVKDIGQLMASFLLGQAGDSLSERLKKRHARKRFEKREHDFFTYQFRDVSDNLDLQILFDFLNGKVVRENLYYSEKDDISDEQKELLWNTFRNYKYNRTNSTYIPYKYKEKLIACVNFHNGLINELILEDKGRLLVKAVDSNQKRIEKSVKDMISTLNTNTPLSDHDVNLNFYVNQLESLISSLRRVLRNKQRFFILTLFGVLAGNILLIFSFANLLQSSKLPLNAIIIYIAVSLISLIYLLLILICAYNLLKKINILENKIQNYTDVLFELHFRHYENFLDNMKI